MNNNFDIYYSRKLFINNQNGNNLNLRYNQERIQTKNKIIMSSDEEPNQINIRNPILTQNKNFENNIESNNLMHKFPAEGNELKDNFIINSINPINKENLINKRYNPLFFIY